MAIPDFQSLMLPLLRMAADGSEHSMAEARDHLARELELTEADLAEKLKSGVSRWANRLAWARVHLDQAALLESPRRGSFRISERGRAALPAAPDRITIRWLEQFPEYLEFRRRKKDGAGPVVSAPGEEETTPEEQIESAYDRLRSELSAELLTAVRRSSPEFFERLVVDLLLKMGYGGSREEAGRAVGRSGDEGIDGIINEDRLGLDVVYIQAKRWQGTIGRPDIQGFVGALHGKRARKGIFITTGSFSGEAKAYVERIDPRVVLIDGRELAEYMIDFGVGVTMRTIYEVKKLDTDYFSEGS